MFENSIPTTLILEILHLLFLLSLLPLKEAARVIILKNKSGYTSNYIIYLLKTLQWLSIAFKLNQSPYQKTYYLKSLMWTDPSHLSEFNFTLSISHNSPATGAFLMFLKHAQPFSAWSSPAPDTSITIFNFPFKFLLFKDAFPYHQSQSNYHFLIFFMHL